MKNQVSNRKVYLFMTIFLSISMIATLGAASVDGSNLPSGYSNTPLLSSVNLNPPLLSGLSTLNLNPPLLSGLSTLNLNPSLLSGLSTLNLNPSLLSGLPTLNLQAPVSITTTADDLITTADSSTIPEDSLPTVEDGS